MNKILFTAAIGLANGWSFFNMIGILGRSDEGFPLQVLGAIVMVANGAIAVYCLYDSFKMIRNNNTENN